LPVRRFADSVFRMIDELIVQDDRVRAFLKTGSGVDGYGAPGA
jgi:hypothetical protein